jgi:hypothetical protein
MFVSATECRPAQGLTQPPIPCGQGLNPWEQSNSGLKLTTHVKFLYLRSPVLNRYVIKLWSFQKYLPQEFDGCTRFQPSCL